MDGSYFTSDDLHVWLAPYNSSNSTNVVTINLYNAVKISMIRIWNYNKSRIHSFRGAKNIVMKLDGETIFTGEIRKAPGMVSINKISECC